MLLFIAHSHFFADSPCIITDIAGASTCSTIMLKGVHQCRNAEDLFLCHCTGDVLLNMSCCMCLCCRVKDSEETFFLKARASVIDDVESMASNKMKRVLE